MGFYLILDDINIISLVSRKNGDRVFREIFGGFFTNGKSILRRFLEFLLMKTRKIYQKSPFFRGLPVDGTSGGRFRS
jgi:hypothetical protein